MGGIFQNPTTKWQPKSDRQAKYLASRKTDRKTKNVKHEQSMQIEYARWFRSTFPGVHFYSDTGSGSFNSSYEKNTHNAQQSDKGLPDTTVFAARHGYHALCLEFKPDGTELKMKRNGRVARVYKNSVGKIIAVDGAPRKVGDWKDFFIERQARRHEELKKAGYCALFSVGLEKSKEITCWYMGVEYVPPAENETLF